MIKTKRTQNFLDMALREGGGGFSDLGNSQEDAGRNIHSERKPILFSRGKRTDSFFTEDSKLYFTPGEMKLLEKGMAVDRSTRKWDSASSRIAEEYKRTVPVGKDFLYEAFEERYATFRESMAEGYISFVREMSFLKMWNATIIAAMIIGMVSMTFIYRYLGEGASAGSIAAAPAKGEPVAEKVLGVEDIKKREKEEAEYIAKIMQDADKKKKKDFENEIREMVKGYPIEKMVPYIAEKDRIVAAFIIGIGRKESAWGEHVPVLNGEDCFNYWGYRGIRKRMGTGGHTCFDSPKDAVDTVAKRIEFLVSNKKLNTPEKMVIWKTGGNAAATGGQAAARKWISDVDIYFKKLNK